MVVSRAIIRDLYPRERVGAMISLVIAVMMVAQMLSALAGGLLEITFGWRAIFYFITAASLSVAILIAIALPETRRDAQRERRLPRRCRLAARKAAPFSAMCCARCWLHRSSSPLPAAGLTSW